MAEALWWERHIVEVLRGIPPDAPPGTAPKPEYDPRLVSLTRREQAKAAELTAAGQPVTASAVKQRRRRYQARGLAAMADHRASQAHAAVWPRRSAGDRCDAAGDRRGHRRLDADRVLYLLAGRADPGRRARGRDGGAAVTGKPLPAVLGLVGWAAHDRVGAHPPVAGRAPGRPVQPAAGQRARRGDGDRLHPAGCHGPPGRRGRGTGRADRDGRRRDPDRDRRGAAADH